MSNLSEKLSPVIHKSLLANGVQLTSKELGPVSKDVAAYVKNSFEAVSKDVQAELSDDKKKADEAKKVDAKVAAKGVVHPVTASAPVSGGALKAPPAPGGAKKKG